MKYLQLLLLALLISGCADKEQLPTLNATDKVLSIMVGDQFYENVWTASPDIALDEFVTQRFEREKEISFISDIDTLSFTIKPNNTYDFVVLLHNSEKAYTRINTDTLKIASLAPEKVMSYYYDDISKKTLTDTIPFMLGDDSRIHLKGKLNNSQKLDVLFDTGANAVVITSSLIGEKVQLQLDGEVSNNGSDGNHTVQTSSGNYLEVSDLNWDDVKLLAIDYQQRTFDMVLGWVAFENKIVEINYDKKCLIIHKSKTTVSKEYSKVATRMIHGIPYIKGTLSVGNIKSSGWFEYDSGYNGSFSLSQKFASENNLNNAMEITGTSVSTGSAGVQYKSNNYVLSKLTFGDYELLDVPLYINEEDPEGVEYNDILGNNVLKRFNAVIDFKDFEVYLKPNTLVNSEY